MEDEDDDKFVLSSIMKAKRTMVRQQQPVGTSLRKRTRKPIQPPKDILEISPDKGDSTRRNLPKTKVKVAALPPEISQIPDASKLDVFRTWLKTGLLKRVGSTYARKKYFL